MTSADDVVTVGPYQLGRKEKILVLAPLSLFVVFFGGLLSSILYIFLIGSLVVSIHGTFHRGLIVDPLDTIDTAAVILPPDFV